MSYFIYNQLMRLLLPFMLLRLKRKSRKQAEYGFRWDERLCKQEIDVASNGVLFHLASLGETIAATPIIKAFMKKNPNVAITITSTTPTGSEQIVKTFGDAVTHCYMPFDLPIIQRRFINKIKPRLLVLMETELWPNLIHHAKKQGSQVVVMNARLSERSAKGYQKFAKLSQIMMSNIDLICAQFEQDATRFKRLGCSAQKIEITGNIKFDTKASEEQQTQAIKLKAQWQLNRPVWLAASTHEGEEAQILAAHKKILISHPNALLILVPRHPERFESVYQQAKQSYYCQRRTLLSPYSPVKSNCQVLLGNTLGEMDLYIALADLVFIGGSLVERGGHNPFEAACQRKPILTGPHLFNFTDSYKILANYNALKTVINQHDLQNEITQLFTDHFQRNQLAEQAYLCQQHFQGSQEKTLQFIQQQFKLPEHLPLEQINFQPHTQHAHR